MNSLWHAIELLSLLYEVKQSTGVVSRLMSGSFFLMAYRLLLECLSGDLRSLVGREYLDNSMRLVITPLEDMWVSHCGLRTSLHVQMPRIAWLS